MKNPKKKRPTTRMTSMDLRAGNRFAFRLGEFEEMLGTVMNTTVRVGIDGTGIQGMELEISVRLDKPDLIARLPGRAR